MRNLFGYFILLLMSGCFYNCETNLMEYEGEEGVYFAVQHAWKSGGGDTTEWEYWPTTSVNFLMHEQTDSLVRLKVALVGNVVDYDRYFKIVVVDTATTAVAGADYDVQEETYKMAANTNYTDVYISTHLTESLKGTTRKVMFMLVETPDFKVPLDLWYPFPEQRGFYPDGSNTTILVTVKYHTIILNGILSEPEGWFAGLFGPFTEKKFEFMCEEFDLTMEDFTKANMGSVRAEALAQRAKIILEKVPHYEADGSRMKMGPAVN